VPAIGDEPGRIGVFATEASMVFSDVWEGFDTYFPHHINGLCYARPPLRIIGARDWARLTR
jgi:hypothetical protein